MSVTSPSAQKNDTNYVQHKPSKFMSTRHRKKTKRIANNLWYQSSWDFLISLIHPDWLHLDPHIKCTCERLLPAFHHNPGAFKSPANFLLIPSSQFVFGNLTVWVWINLPYNTQRMVGKEWWGVAFSVLLPCSFTPRGVWVCPVGSSRQHIWIEKE